MAVSRARVAIKCPTAGFKRKNALIDLGFSLSAEKGTFFNLCVRAIPTRRRRHEGATGAVAFDARDLRIMKAMGTSHTFLDCGPSRARQMHF